MFWKKEVVQVPSDDRIRQLASEAIKGNSGVFWSTPDLYNATEQNGLAIRALLLRLGYSPHNAMVHGKLVPLTSEPGEYPPERYPYQTPVLDKEV